jgi:hypothetical protein
LRVPSPHGASSDDVRMCRSSSSGRVLGSRDPNPLRESDERDESETRALWWRFRGTHRSAYDDLRSALASVYVSSCVIASAFTPLVCVSAFILVACVVPTTFDCSPRYESWFVVLNRRCDAKPRARAQTHEASRACNMVSLTLTSP